MTDDVLWYEASFVVGITNALNVVADGLADHGALLPTSEPSPSSRLGKVYSDIRSFYQLPADGPDDAIPAPFRVVASDPGYTANLWDATERAFSDRRLTRRHKEAIAFAVSLTSHSSFGTGFHLAEMRRLGVGDRGVTEVIGVTQMFSSYTKIADTLKLEPDMGHIAPVDTTPVPQQGELPETAPKPQSQATPG